MGATEERPTAPRHRRRAIVPALLGLAAAAALAAWLVLLLGRPSEVRQLLDILSGQHAPDAAWAFEKLKVVSDEELHELVAHVDDARPTPLQGLHFASRSVSGGTGTRDTRFTVGQVARFILPYRTGDEALGSSWDGGRVRAQAQAYTSGVERALRTGRKLNGHASDAARSSLVWPPEILRPPSRVSAIRPSGIAPDIPALVLLVKGPDTALAHWSLSTLQKLPVDQLDGLGAYLRDETPSRIASLSLGSAGGITITTNCFRTGAVAAAVLLQHLQRQDLDGMVVDTTDFQDGNALFLELADKVQAAWDAFRQAR